MKATNVILLFVTCVSTCFAADNQRQAQNDDIREAVFRYQIENARPSQKENAEVYFLAVAETEKEDPHAVPPLPLPLGNKRHDPSDELMRRLNPSKPPLLKNSALRIRTNNPKRGLRFRVTTIKWISDEEVEAKGGHDDYWSTEWKTFTVRKENGKWKVTKAKLKGAVVACRPNNKSCIAAERSNHAMAEQPGGPDPAGLGGFSSAGQHPPGRRSYPLNISRLSPTDLRMKLLNVGNNACECFRFTTARRCDLRRLCDAHAIKRRLCLARVSCAAANT